jgi:hypothetical protein
MLKIEHAAPHDRLSARPWSKRSCLITPPKYHTIAVKVSDFERTSGAISSGRSHHTGVLIGR